jgi:hypothetical protein
VEKCLIGLLLLYTSQNLLGTIFRVTFTVFYRRIWNIVGKYSILCCDTICVNFCPRRNYYVLGKDDMSRACIHLGMHNHPVSDGIYRETLDTISGLIAQEVSKIPTTKNSAITMAASKEFLDKYLIHMGPGPKKMTWKWCGPCQAHAARKRSRERLAHV